MCRDLVVFGFGVILLLRGTPAESRPPYYSAFKKAYPHLAEKKISCAVCHQGSEKEKLNHYGAAMEKELGEKRVKDEKRIIEAIHVIEKGECRTGKWAKRLDAGLAPCVDGDVVDTHSVIARWLQSENYKRPGD